MIQAKCIQKFRNKSNQIYGYRIQDCNGKQKDITPDKLKTAIKNNQITIINLTLTSDNRLIDTTPTQQPSKISEEQKFKNIITKAKLLGSPIKEIPTACNHKCCLISQSPTQHLIYIPDDVIKLNKNNYNKCFTDNIKNLQGTLKVIGGKNLTDMHRMFYECQAQSLDLSSLNTSKVTDMGYMFYKCQAQSIDLSNFDTSNVTNMEYMFCKCQAQSIDLSSFNTSNVTNMADMFCECQAQSLDLSSFDTSKVENIAYIFYECQAQFIDLSSFNTSNVRRLGDLFYRCQAKIKATDTLILEEYNGSR